MKTHITYIAIILLMLLGGLIHFRHHLEVERELEIQQRMSDGHKANYELLREQCNKGVQ